MPPPAIGFSIAATGPLGWAILGGALIIVVICLAVSEDNAPSKSTPPSSSGNEKITRSRRASSASDVATLVEEEPNPIPEKASAVDFYPPKASTGAIGLRGRGTNGSMPGSEIETSNSYTFRKVEQASPLGRETTPERLRDVGIRISLETPNTISQVGQDQNATPAPIYHAETNKVPPGGPLRRRSSAASMLSIETRNMHVIPQTTGIDAFSNTLDTTQLDARLLRAAPEASSNVHNNHSSVGINTYMPENVSSPQSPGSQIHSPNRPSQFESPWVAFYGSG